MSSDKEQTGLDLVLDYPFEDLAGEEERFKEAVLLDIAMAVGADVAKMRVVSLEAGSVIASLLLEQGLCGEGGTLNPKVCSGFCGKKLNWLHLELQNGNACRFLYMLQLQL